MHLKLQVDVLRQRRDALQRSLRLSDAQLQKVIRTMPMLLTSTAAGIEQKASAMLA